MDRIPVIKAKLMAPELPQKVLHSDRIKSLGINKHRAVILTAPSGFGKTTAALLFLNSKSGRVYWYRLEREDSLLQVFYAHLIEVLFPQEGGKVSEAAQSLGSIGSISDEYPLLNAILCQNLWARHSEDRDPVYLVLDDFHMAAGSTAHIETIRYFITNMPPAFRIILISRVDPGIRSGRLILNNDIVEIQEEALRFTKEETVKLTSQEKDIAGASSVIETSSAAFSRSGNHIMARVGKIVQYAWEAETSPENPLETARKAYSELCELQALKPGQGFLEHCQVITGALYKAAADTAKAEKLLLQGYKTSWKMRKIRGILKYILANPEKTVSREYLSSLFWPESDAKAASTSLRAALYELRKILARCGLAFESQDALLMEENNGFRLYSPDRIETDTGKFMELYERYKSSSNAPDGARTLLSKMVELYAGDFLEDDPYDEWTILSQEQYRSIFVEASHKLTQIYMEQNDIEPAEALLDRIMKVDPLDSAACGALLKLFGNTCQETQAVVLRRQFEKRYKAEIGVLPEWQAAHRPSEKLPTGQVASHLPAQAGLLHVELHPVNSWFRTDPILYRFKIICTDPGQIQSKQPIPVDTHVGNPQGLFITVLTVPVLDKVLIPAPPGELCIWPTLLPLTSL